MPKGLTHKTKALIEGAYTILGAEHPMTLRQLFYRLVSVHVLANTRASYQKLSRVMTQARENYEIRPEWIVDRSKPEIIPSVWKNMSEYLKTVERSYRLDYWKDQSYYTEVWIEKDSLTGSIEGVCNEYGVTLRAHRGYGSTTKKMEIADLFDTIDVPIRIFYIGDFDPSGVDIERDLLEKIIGYKVSPFNFPEIIRLGILQEDIAEFKLPPLRVKDKDPRTRGFRQKYGAEAVKADALPPVELRKRIKDAIEGLIDHDLWDHKVMVEKAEFKSLRKFVKNLNSMQEP